MHCAPPFLGPLEYASIKWVTLDLFKLTLHIVQIHVGLEFYDGISLLILSVSHLLTSKLLASACLIA